MYNSANKITINTWNKHPPQLDKNCLLTKILLLIFCQIVDKVIAIRAIIVATNPSIGISFPKSKPSTNEEPIKPKNTPIHCLIETFSFNIGPLSRLVKIG